MQENVLASAPYIHLNRFLEEKEFISHFMGGGGHIYRRGANAPLFWISRGIRLGCPPAPHIFGHLCGIIKVFFFKYSEIMSMKRDCNFDFYLISKFNQYYNVNYSILGYIILSQFLLLLYFKIPSYIPVQWIFSRLNSPHPSTVCNFRVNLIFRNILCQLTMAYFYKWEISNFLFSKS